MQIGADRARQRVGALTHQPGIGAEQQHGADLRVGPVQKAVDLAGGKLHGVPIRGPVSAARRCRNRVSRVTISRRNSSTARVRASSSATTLVYSLARISNESATWLVMYKRVAPVLISRNVMLAVASSLPRLPRPVDWIPRSDRKVISRMLNR